MSVIDLIPYVILACCVLHNLCLEGCNDSLDDFIEEGRQHNERDNERDTEQNQNRRLIGEEIIHNDTLGPTKRNYLAALIS